MRIARKAAALAIVATLTGCSGSQVARSRITPGRTSVERTETTPTTYRIIIRPPRPVYVPVPAEPVDGGVE